MAREYSNFTETNSFYYSFPYEYSSDSNHAYQPQSQAYFNNCSSYGQNVGPVRIDMTAYIQQRPPPMTRHDLFESAQSFVAPGANSALLIEPLGFTDSRNYGDDKNRQSYANQRKSVVCQRPPGPLVKAEHEQVEPAKRDYSKMANELQQIEDRQLITGNKTCAKFQCFLCGKKYCRQR